MPCRIGALEGGARGIELIVPEKLEPLVERLLIDAIHADTGGQASGDLRQRLRLAHVQPDDEGRVAYGRCQSGETKDAIS